MTSLIDIDALTEYTWVGSPLATAGDSPYVVRFLVQGVQNVESFFTSADVTTLTELTKAVSLDFDKYLVLGIAATPLAPNDVVGGQVAGEGALLADVVFKLTEWNTMVPSFDKMGQMAAELWALRNSGMVAITVIGYFTLSYNPQLSAKWMTKTPIFQRVSTAAILIPTQTWRDTVMVKKPSPSFLRGVSTDPDSATPIVIGSAAVIPPDPIPKDDQGAIPIPSFNVAGVSMSVDKIAVAALMGYLGFRLIKAWRKF